MTSMPKCGALRDAVGGWDWVKMMSLYCQSSVADEHNFAGRLSDLLQEMINAYDEKVEFIRELEVMSGVVAAVKTTKFLNENLWKDDKRIQKLHNMNIDVGMKAVEMENFGVGCSICYAYSDTKCYNGMVANVRLAGQINWAALEVNDTIMVRDQFLEELDSLGVRHVPSKMAEFLREIQMRDTETVAKLQVLVAEMELNARKKDVFIQKLKVTKEDRQIATKLNRLREEMLVLCEKRKNIAHELRIFRSIVVISKAAEFVAESVRKANDQAVQVREVETEIEATVLEKRGVHPEDCGKRALLECVNGRC
ncbi:hypothetical protein Tco_0840281 [Tanacetum coccineum]|uniref:Uncharacterized protein n=1 Tax=Tanacetum coccineum TaxID=301880 RepID=A0ABQ5AXL3_9ASTR